MKTFLALVLILLSFNLALADDSHTAKAKLGKVPVQSKFSFVVIGDSRDWRPVVQPPVFKRAIQEINLLRPTFAIDVGDLIRGYSGDSNLIKAEWDEYVKVTSQAQVAFFSVVGNHDIWNEASQPTYQHIMGELYYSFNYGDSHFVVLDTEVPGYVGKFSPEEIEWLKKDLEANAGAKNVFAFMHQPFFYNRTLWEPIHQLLKQHNGKAVFAGHLHYYRKEARDGIRYIITGGGGAEIGSHPRAGDFHHYTLVTVEGDDIHVAVIKPGAIESEDIVTSESRDLYFKLRDSFSAKSTTMPAPGGKSPVEVTVKNLLPQPIEGILEWRLGQDGWLVTPATANYSVAPGATQVLPFEIGFSGASPTLPPEFRTSGRYLDDRVAEVRKPLMMLSVTPSRAALEYDAVKLPEKPKIDGSLGDWDGVYEQPLGQLTSAPGFSSSGPDDLSGKFRCAWDGDSFYLAVTVADQEFSQEFSGPDTWKGDAIRFGMDINYLGGRIYQEFTMARTKTGPEVYCSSGTRRGRLLKDVKFAVMTQNGATVYEAAFPWYLLDPLAPLANVSAKFNVMAWDTDSGRSKGQIQWAGGIGGRADTSKFGSLSLK